MPSARAYISSLKQSLSSVLSGQGADERTIELAWLVLFDLLQHEDLNVLTSPQIIRLLEEHEIPTALTPATPETEARQLLWELTRSTRGKSY